MAKQNRKGRAVYFIWLFINLCVVGGIYIFANMMYFLPIMGIYSAISCIGLCVYIFFYMQDQMKISQGDESSPDEFKRKKRLKIIVTVFLPFLTVLMFDFVYVLLLYDSPVFQSIISIFQ